MSDRETTTYQPQVFSRYRSDSDKRTNEPAWSNYGGAFGSEEEAQVVVAWLAQEFKDVRIKVTRTNTTTHYIGMQKSG